MSNANLSSSDSEDSDDDDEEEEEEYARASKRKAGKAVGGGKQLIAPKRSKTTARQSSASAFFDMEAAVDDEDEEEEDEEEEMHYKKQFNKKKRGASAVSDKDREREQLDAQTREMMRLQDKRRAAAGGFFTSLEARAALAEEDEDRSVANMARTIEERHKASMRTVDLDEASARPAYAADYSAVSQQSLVPSVSDPSLWMVGCKPGKEAELVMQIMNKAIASALQGRALGITSAIASQTKGQIYIESYSEPAVIEAIQGIRDLLQYKFRLVPIGDMTTVMSVTVKKKPVKKNDWVRLTRGHFKGDLALVIGVKEGGLKCVVQCVPRLDYSLSELSPEEQKVRRRTVRPPQKFFSASDVADKYTVTRQRFPGMNERCDVYEGNFYHDGYLLKELAVGTMIRPCGDEEPPTLDELQRFQRRQQRKKVGDFDDVDGNEDEVENEGSKKAASLLEQLSDLQQKDRPGKGKVNGGLTIGDTVEVIEGDLVGMRGKLLSVDGTTVKVKPSETMDLGHMAEIEFLIGQVRKYIPPGAHVKVIDGRYANETGTVVAIDDADGGVDCLAVVLTDMTHKEISVRTSQLQESAEVASGQDKLAGYELHDLVVLSGGGATNEVGVIVRVGREEFTIVNNHGIVREVRPEELRGKRNSSSKRAVALDVQGNQIRVGDNVSVAEGPHKGKTATIKQMNRAQLFLYSQTRTENAGIIVVRSRSCVLSGARNRPMMADTNGNGGFNARGSGVGARGGKKDDNIIGKTVRVQNGQWKGYIGTVADATTTHVHVELHSRMKKVMVLRGRIAVVGDKFGSTDNPDREYSYNNSGAAPTTPFLGGATPMHGGATPMHGGITPMHEGGLGGGFTPSHADNTDDVWRPGSIDQTPRRDDNLESTDFGTYNSDSASSDVFGGNNAQIQGTLSLLLLMLYDTVTHRFFNILGSGLGWGASTISDQSTPTTWTPSTNSDPNLQFSSSQSVQSAPVDNLVSAPPSSDSSITSSSFASESYGNDSSTTNVTSASIDSGAESTAVWFMERVVVEVLRNGAIGTIKEVNSNNSARLDLEDGQSLVIKGAGEVKLVSPKEHDTVLVTGGADVGVEGELVCIDGEEAIIKDGNDEFKIIDFVHLAKIVSDD